MNISEIFKREKELNLRMEAEIKKNKVLRDIKISSDELKDIREILKFVLIKGYLEVESLILARYLVEMGYENYDEKRYWNSIFEELGLERNKYYSKITTIFIKTLEKYNLRFLSEGNKYLLNVLNHTYVPKNYLEKFYKFLESFYIKELSQDLEENILDEEIEALQDYLENEDNKVEQAKMINATYQLIRPVKKSMYVNRNEFKNYFKNYLKVLDNYWWLGKNDHKLSFPEEEELLKEWIESSGLKQRKNSIRKEKRFSSPTLLYDKDSERIYLYIPRQKIDKEQYKSQLEYKLLYGNEKINSGNLISFLSSGRILTEQEKIEIREYLPNLVLEISSGELSINRFKLWREPFIVFNSKFEGENIRNLKNGEKYYIYSNINFLMVIDQVEKELSKGIEEFVFDPKDEMYIEISEERYMLGKRKGSRIEGVAEKGLTLKNKEDINIYSEAPQIYLTTEVPVENIRLDLNEKKYKLKELQECISREDDEIICDLKIQTQGYEGMLKIDFIDMETNKSIYKKDIYILNSNLNLDKDIYEFEENIFITTLLNPNLNHKYYKSKNGIRIPLTSYTLTFKHMKETLNYEVPVLRWKHNEKNWQMKKIEMWHEEFKGQMTIIHPQGKNLKLQLGENQIIEGVKVKDGCTFDLNKFSDFFRESKEEKQILYLIAGDKKIEIGFVITKFVIKEVTVGYQYNSQTLLVSMEIIGKGKYCIRLYSDSGEKIKELRYEGKKLEETKLLTEIIPLPDENISFSIITITEEEDEFFGDIEKIEELQYEKIFSPKEKKKNHTLVVDKVIYEEEEYLVGYFGIENIEKIEDGYYRGNAYYKIRGEKKYYGASNPFKFKIEKDYLIELVDDYGEQLIYDKEKGSLRTDEPEDGKKDYNRLIIPEKYGFKNGGEN